MEDVDVIAVARLHRDGQRYTDKRRQLLHLLAGAKGPLTIPDMLKRRRNLAQSSVYRNLVVLEMAGLVQKIVTRDEWARYELAEDLTEHHHHLICSECGSVQDFVVSPRLERSVDQAFAKIAEKTGFTNVNHRLDLVGVCPTCTT